MARRYRPSAPVRSRQLAGAAAGAALGSGLAGLAAHEATRVAPSLEPLVLIAMGLAVGAATALAVQRSGLSRPQVAGALAIAATLAALASMLALDFRAARSTHQAQLDREQHMREQAGLATRAELAAERAADRQRFTAGRYVRGRIGLGPGIGPGAEQAVLGPTAAALVSALELILAALLAGVLARSAASEPACPSCGRWRDERALGRARAGVSRPLVERLLARDMAGAASLLAAPDTREMVLLTRLVCPLGHDGAAGLVRIREVMRARRRRRDLVLGGRIDIEVSGDEMAALTRALESQG